MILYASMSSDDSKAIRFYIETFNISCSYHDLDKGDAEEAKKTLLRKNPIGCLPCLEDSDKFIFGTAPILMYLAEEYTNFSMCGTSTPESRCKVESFLLWSATSLARSVYYNFAAPRMFENHSIGEFENISLVTMGKDEITAHFDTIEKFYLTNNNQTYLINNEFSIADVFTAITISSLEPLLFDFSPWPTLCKWFEKVKTDIAKTSQYNNRCKFLSRPRIL